jgi:hypothetical protein
VRKTIISIAPVLSLALSLGGSVAFAQASQTKTEAAYKITYETGGLNPTTQGNITALDEPKHEIAFFIELADTNDPQKAMAPLDELMKTLVTNVKPVGAPAKAKWNGMEVVKITATGDLIKPSKPVKIAILLLKTPADKYVGVVALVDSAKEGAWTATFGKIMNSFQPTK